MTKQIYKCNIIKNKYNFSKQSCLNLNLYMIALSILIKYISCSEKEIIKAKIHIFILKKIIY
jgi:hypothetical protein